MAQLACSQIVLLNLYLFLISRRDMNLGQGQFYCCSFFIGDITLSSVAFILTNGCSRSCDAVGLLSLSWIKHCLMKSWQSSERCGGISGISPETTLLKSCPRSLMLGQGCPPVANSIIVHPRDQISLRRPTLSPLMHSGAIQRMLPLMSANIMPDWERLCAVKLFWSCCDVPLRTRDSPKSVSFI